jgi:transposase-like protein
MAESTYTHDTGNVECPFCGEKNDLTESIGNQGEMLDSWECSGCAKTFIVRIHFSISVTAEAL